MRILVTGGAGFIGSNLVHALVAAGHAVGVVDDLSTGSAANLHPSAWFRRLDILDPALDGVVAEFAPEAVVHLAAQVDVARSIADPERDRAVNVDGTRRVARAAVAAGARRMLSASSAAVYGEPVVVPAPESAEKAPANPYGESKLAAEGVLAGELNASGVDFACFRFSNVYGPRQDWRGEGGVVAIFAARMLAGQPPVVFGDGRQTRDFVFVGDVVMAHLAALEHVGPLTAAGPDGPAYNVSTGTEVSLEQLLGVMRSSARYLGPVECVPARHGDVLRSALDPSKAAERFGWRAEVPLENGVETTVRWFERSRG